LVDRLRSYKVVVDGQTAATLRRGEDVVVPVPAGHHAVKAKIDWGRSREIDLELGERDRVHLLCQPGFTLSLLRPRALLYVTIWRNRYLDLQFLRVESDG
jgi:hypothetical protein